MSVAAGNLDALLGISGTLSDLYGASVDSYTTSGPTGADVVATLTATVGDTNNLGVPTGSGATFRVAAIDDATGAVTLALIIGTTVILLNEYAIAFTGTSILLSDHTTNIVAKWLDQKLNAVNTVQLLVLSTVPLAAGAAITFSAAATYSGPTNAHNVATVSGAGSVAAPVSGSYNAEVIANPPADTVVAVTPGYQAASIAGATPTTLIDANGDTLLIAGSGNTTLLSTAGGDTLQAGAGNDVLVSFTGPAVETATGQPGDNLFYGGGAPVTILGGNGQDTAIMSSGGAITTGGGGTQIWLNTGATLIDSTGADTVVAGGGSATVSVAGSADALVFAGSGTLLFQGSSGPSTVVGLKASVTVNAAAGGGVFYGGTAGHNVLTGGEGPADLIAGGDGDVLTATGGASDVLLASSGAETLNAAGSSGGDAFFGGNGSDRIIGGTGANAFTAGPGAMTLVGGGRSDLFVFLDGATSKTVIQGFNPAHDTIKLSGFAAGADQAALNGATTSGAKTLFTLSDGTQITLSGITPAMLTVANFV